MQEGYANTKLFQAVANDRRSKKFIPKIRQGTKIITDQDKIMDVFADAYNNILGKASARGHSLELDLLGMLELDLLDLDCVYCSLTCY